MFFSSLNTKTAITSLYDYEFVQISSVVSNQTDKGVSVLVNEEEVYSKDGKEKSSRNQAGASSDMIIVEE